MITKFPSEIGWTENQKYTLLYKWGIRYRLKRIGYHSRGKVLDIGWYQSPNPFLKNVVGLDAVATENLPYNYRSSLKIDLNNPYPYPFIDDCFDTVTAGEIIEHVTNLDSFLKEISRVLKPGGKLIISTPNPASPVATLVHFFKWFFKRVDFNYILNGGHVQSFLFTEMINLLNLYHFKPIKMEGTYIQIPFTNIQIPLNIQPITYCTIYVAVNQKKV